MSIKTLPNIHNVEHEGTISLPSRLASLVRIVLAFVLLAAVIGKVADPSLFLSFVSSLLDFSIEGAKVIFILTVCSEALLGSALLLLRHQAWPLMLTGVLFVVFASIIAYALLVDVQDSCGCFGTFALQQEAKPLSLARNLCLALAALFTGFQHTRTNAT